MACGCPVVCANTTSLPEVGGEAPLYIDPGSVEQLETAILKVISDRNLKEQMIRKGFEQAEKFTWQKTASKVLDVYRQIAGQ